MPSRAVATTRNSPEPSSTSVSSRRKNGLSSTTSTRLGSELLDTMSHGNHFHLAVVHPQAHRTPEVPADRFADQADPVGAEHLPCRDQVPFAHLDGSGRRQSGKHA